MHAGPTVEHALYIVHCTCLSTMKLEMRREAMSVACNDKCNSRNVYSKRRIKPTGNPCRFKQIFSTSALFASFAPNLYCLLLVFYSRLLW